MTTAASCPGPRPTLRAMSLDKAPRGETLGRKERNRRLVLKAGSTCGIRRKNSRICEGEASVNGWLLWQEMATRDGRWDTP